ncbi:MAG: heme ABC transporter ATP-binding protein [Nitrospira sp.]|nr:heme ABC transporter ATP-binding protein [Nitrospira sp.]
MIETYSISVKVGHQFLLQGVSLQVAPGKTVALVGPNGAGKSTFLKVLCSDLAPSQGDVWMAGKPLMVWSPLERARLRAVLPQNSTLSFPFTALEVVLIGRMPYGKSLEQTHDYEVARAALEAVQMSHLEMRLYTTLSGGKRQRVQLARVLAQIWEASPVNARYLLLDEPTTGLDLAHQHGSLEIVRDFARARVGVLLILHDLNLAAQYADRALVLKAGRLLAEGSPHDVLTSRVIRTAFAISVVVTPYPYLDCPLIVPAPMLDKVKLPRGR